MCDRLLECRLVHVSLFTAKSVSLQAVAQSLDQGWSSAGAGPLCGIAEGIDQGNWIIAIDFDTRHFIRLCS